MSILVAALAACGGDDDDAAETDREAAAASAPAEGAIAEAPPATNAVAAETADVGEGGGTIDIGVVGRDVIIEMYVVLGSDDLQRSVAAISADASALGGGIASSDIVYGPADATSPETGHAVLVVKVPPESVDRLLDGLADTGTVRSISQSAQDVTDQLVDLDVRIDNARQSVATVREFMDATQNLGELVTLEAELTRRQTELEQLEAQQRNLSERVALSTVTIEIVPNASLPELDEHTGIGGAFADGWHAFAVFLFGIAYLIAVLAPFLIVGSAVAWAAWKVVRRRRRGHDGPAPLPAPAPGGDAVNEPESVSASPPG